MKIEVEEFVRTKGGIIQKCIDVDDNYVYADEVLSYSFQGDVEIANSYIQKSDIIKHSKNIIDLIEAGDILEIKEGNDICYLGLEKDTITVNYKDIIEDIKNKKCELLSILTHEEYKQNCYRLEEYLCQKKKKKL